MSSRRPLLILPLTLSCLLPAGCAPSGEPLGEELELPSEQVVSVTPRLSESLGPQERQERDGPSPAPNTTEEYFFTDDESLLFVKVFHAREAFLEPFVHDHVIRARSWSGEAVLNPADLSDCSFALELPVAALSVDEDSLRQALGYSDTVPAPYREVIREHMLDYGQLAAENHPTIRFSSKVCGSGRGPLPEDGLLPVQGDLTIRGVTQAVRLPLQVRVYEDRLFVRGELDIWGSDFGIAPFRAFGGAVQNQDRLELGFDMVGFSGR